MRHAYGLLLLWSLAAGGAAWAQSATLVIADFEGERAETTSGLALWLYSDEQFGGTSEARVALIHPGADGSRGAIRISFRVTADAPLAFAGAWAMVGPEGLATDLSAYRGVRFYARSKDGGAFAAGVVRFPGRIVRYTMPFQVRPEWTVVELPFDKFQQVPPAGASPLDPKDMTAIGIGAAPQRRGEFEIDVDRIELYR